MFMMVLMIRQHDKYLKSKKKLDTVIEILLNDQIYKKYIGLSKLEAYKARHECLDYQIAEIHEENTKQMSLILYLIQKSKILSKNNIYNYIVKKLKDQMTDRDIYPENK